MTDEQGVASDAPEVGQLPETAPPVEQELTDANRQYVTADYLDRRLSEMETLMDKALKSSRDHYVRRMEKAVEVLKERGFSDDEIKIAQKRIREDEATAAYQEAVSGPDGGGVQPPLSPDIAKMMMDLSNKHGVAIFMGEPEAAILDAINPYTTPPEVVQKKYEEALIKKKQRLSVVEGQPPQEPPEQPPHNPAARTPGLTGGTVTGDRLTQLTSELQDIQSKDPWNNNKELSKRRAEILRELRGG